VYAADNLPLQGTERWGACFVLKTVMLIRECPAAIYRHFIPGTFFGRIKRKAFFGYEGFNGKVNSVSTTDLFY
jgi:hypothetical protein